MKNADDEIIRNLDKSIVDKRMKELENLLTEFKDEELLKTTDEIRKKALIGAFNKAIKELNEVKEKIENSIEQMEEEVEK